MSTPKEEPQPSPVPVKEETKEEKEDKQTKLHKAFNVALLQWLRRLQRSFQKEAGLNQEVARSLALFRQNQFTDELIKRFEAGFSHEHIDMVFARDPLVLSASEYMARINMSGIYKRFVVDKAKNIDEQAPFWKQLTGLVRWLSMVKACGSSLGNLETIATKFIHNNPGLPQEQYQEKLIEQMMQGGEMSGYIKEVLTNPDSINAMLDNVGNVLRREKGKKFDFRKLISMMSDEDAQDEEGKAEPLDMAKEFDEFQEVLNSGELPGVLGGLGGLFAGKKGAQHEVKPEPHPPTTLEVVEEDEEEEPPPLERVPEADLD